MYTFIRNKGREDSDNGFHGGGGMKSTKVIIAVIALCIGAGLFGGYRIWGTRGQGEGDIKQLLRNLEEEVGLIEQKNKDLVASIESSKADIEASDAVKKENQELKDQLQAALQEKQGLESSRAEWKAKEADAIKQAEVEHALRTDQDDLKKMIAALESRNRDLAGRLQKAEQEKAEKEDQLAQIRNELAGAHEKASQGEKFQLLADDLKARITELETENRELRSVIDNISELTQRKQEAREAPGETK